MTSKRRLVAALTAAAAVIAVLAGCSSSSDSAGSSAPTESGRPIQTQEPDGLPADFPRDRIPVVPGEVTSVDEGSAKDPGYAVSVLADGSESAAMQQAVDLLEGAGWKTVSSGDAGQVAVLSQDGDQIIVTSALTSGFALITYAVTLASPPSS